MIVTSVESCHHQIQQLSRVGICHDQIEVTGQELSHVATKQTFWHDQIDFRHGSNHVTTKPNLCHDQSEGYSSNGSNAVMSRPNRTFVTVKQGLCNGSENCHYFTEVEAI